MQETIDWVRQCRNNKIKSFSEKHIVSSFFQENYNAALSDLKYEFLSRELNELLIAPVDLVHYSAVVKAFKESPDKSDLPEQCELLAMKELTVIFKKYIF